MFVSPCTLRSTQCAALIALAAAAGIARVETTNGSRSRSISDSDQSTAGATHSALSFRGSFFQLPAFAAAPWIERFAAMAVSFFAPPTGETQTRLVAGQIVSASDSHPIEAEAAISHASIREPATADNAAALINVLLPALCTHTHLLPFAVGPPAPDALTHPTAVGTSVSGDSAAQGTFAPCVAFSASVYRDARLARPFDPRPIFAGSIFRSRFALRGESQLARNDHALRSRVHLPRLKAIIVPSDL
jgi:hypothetical protein